jgi:protein involved in polysaccharide export with SLBB domain
MKNPNVRAESFMRMAVLGAVTNQGYYVVRTDAMLMDVLKMAGGLGGGAELKGISLERGGDKIWEGEALQEAIVQGKTVDQLSLRAGDRIVVPVQTTGGFFGKIASMRRGSMLPIGIVLSLLGVNIWRRGR